MNVLDNFKIPPKGYGEVAFFWWHGDKITKEKLFWILEQLKTHAISGLQINYAHGDTGGESYGLTLVSDPRPLSQEWWELVGWFISECKKYDIAVSLSDYTLGSPGQQFYMDEVIKKHPQVQGQRLEFDNGEVKIVKVRNSVNPMHRDLGKYVIEEFYGKFDEHFTDECGKGVNFFFSDELNFNIRGNLWSDDFAREFELRKGYDITEKLKAIFIDIGDETPKIRLDYYDVIVQLSEEGYFKPVFDWHEQRGMIFGCDHGGRGKDVTEFGDYFRTMKWNQGPGNDQPQLGSDVVKNKVSSSIAHLYKRPRTWLEGFYSSGWGTSSADVTDATFRNFAMGHNLLSLHGLYYSTYGSMWEWAPPCNHFHMPYWEGMKEFLDCTQRLSYLLSQGVHRCDVGIIYPVSTMEVDVVAGQKSVDTAFDIANLLYPSGVDFDFIDFDSIISATVDDKMLKISGEQYKVIIIPSMGAVRFQMIKKIEEFSKSGGIVICIGNLPTESERIGRNDLELQKAVESLMDNNMHLVKSSQEALDVINSEIVRDFKSDTDNVYMLHRIIDDKDLYLVYNVSKGKKVFFRAKGTPVLLDPWTGECERISIEEFSCNDEGTVITMPLEKTQLHLIVFSNNATDITAEKEEIATVINVEGVWNCELKPTMDNSYGDYRLPASNDYIGAEVRNFKFKMTNEDCSSKEFDDNLWEEKTYSYGTQFWLCKSSITDENTLINMTSPTAEFTSYDFSMRMGVQGDAGHQSSYHGLKGKVSDDFITLGKMRLTYASSSSVYEDEGDSTLYYLFTTVYSDKAGVAKISSGELNPDKIWINHQEVSALSTDIPILKGNNYVLLKYTHSGRTHFALQTLADDIKTHYPLAMKWYKNPTLIPFDAIPEQAGNYCWYRFKSPPAMESLTLKAVGDVKVYANGELLKQNGDVFTAVSSCKGESQIAISIKQEHGFYGASAIIEPIQFVCGEGIIHIGDWSKMDGLACYSGGILYSKTMIINKICNKVMLNMGMVVSTAKVTINGKYVGMKVSPPFMIDITDYVQIGDNKIEILVHNTLANHMTTIPTHYNGSLKSGIIGLHEDLT